MQSAPDNCIYVIDTSSWLSIEGNPAQNLILSRISILAERGRIKVPPEVIEELTQVSSVVDWVRQNQNLLLERNTSSVEYLLLGGRIAHEFPAMAGTTGKRNKADPWVIATAIHGGRNPHAHVVVCDETIRKRAGRKIPTACQKYKVECCSLMEMLAREFDDA